MPELPEVETVCRGITPFIEGERLCDVHLHRANLRIPFPELMAETSHQLLHVAPFVKPITPT